MKNLIFFVPLFILFSCKQENANVKNSQIPKEEKKESTAAANKSESEFQDLTIYGIANDDRNSLGGLKVGDVAPDFTAKDQLGTETNLYSILNDAEVVLTFYRAHWCGYCTKHLSHINGFREILDEKAISSIAVSPEKPNFAKDVTDKHGLQFSIIHDADNSIMKDYKVLYHVTEEYQNKVKKGLSKEIKEVNGQKESVMPIPATYLIGKDRKVKYAFYDPDYSKRLKVEDILALYD